MIILCWAAKGGSGTTVVAATLALTSAEPTLLVDLAGDLPASLGLPDPTSPGLFDWLRSDAPSERLAVLESAIRPGLHMLHMGSRGDHDPSRWATFVQHLKHERRRVIIDAGSADPPPNLVRAAEHSWLITRPCYLALRAALRQDARPSGVIVVEEPGRALGPSDIEATLGAPIVARVLQDPSVARAADAGLLVSRLPAAYRRQLKVAA